MTILKLIKQLSKTNTKIFLEKSYSLEYGDSKLSIQKSKNITRLIKE